MVCAFGAHFGHAQPQLFLRRTDIVHIKPAAHGELEHEHVHELHSSAKARVKPLLQLQHRADISVGGGKSIRRMRRRHLHRLCPKIEPVLICHLERHDAEAGCTEHIEIRALAFPHVRKAVLLQVVAYPLTLFFFNQQVEVFAAPFIVFTVKPHERHSVEKHISVFPGVEQLQQLLGHRKIDTTLQYAMVKQSNVKLAHRKYIG